MSFLYVILCILIFFVISYDDLKRLHPITTKSEIPDSERKLVDMNKEKIYIPFRMVDYENKFIDHRGILYIKPYLIEGRFNNEIGMDLKYTLLNYKFCNETSIVNQPDSYKIDVPLNELFCIEEEHFLFGGNWNHNFLNYLEINLYLCEEGVAFNSSDPRCSKIDNYLKKINNSLLFDFYFPIVQFQPKNIKHPIQIIYKNYYYRLSSYSYKIEKLYIREHILSDDINILKSNYKNSSYWGKSVIYGDDYFLPSNYDPISNNSNTSRIYSLNIYMDDGFVYYTRTFKKFILIIADFFPTFRLLLFLLKKFTKHIKMSLTKRKLIELVFENKAFKPKKISKKNENFKININQPKNNLNNENKLINKNKSLNNSEYSKLNYINNNITIIKNNNNHNENKIDNKINNINNSINNTYNNKYNIIKKRTKSSYNEESPSKNLYKYDFPLKALDGNQNIQNIETFKVIRPHKNHKIILAYKRSKYLFPFYYYFLDIIFDNIINPKRFFNLSKRYFMVYNFMCRIYDISSHIIMIKQFNILKNILQEKICDDISKINKKININDYKAIENFGNEFKHNKSYNFNYVS